MASSERSEFEPFTLFCLHYLGGSAREWTLVADRLAPHVRCIGIDLPGFGDAADVTGYTVTDMARYVTDIIRSKATERWILAGHSMGAKVAAVLARNAEEGAEGLGGLAGLVLLAGSPPSPEPMPEQQRQKMLGWFSGDAESNRAEAREYVSSNSGTKLDANRIELAVTDVLRTNRAAWRAWLNDGSREDWSERVGVLCTPTLVIAGADDENLGPDAQHRLTVPHFADVRSITLTGAKHLLPMECADDVARAIREHVVRVRYSALIASNRVSTETRRALMERARPDDPAYEPRALDAGAFDALRAVVSRVIPQPSGLPTIDLAARIDERLASGVGDGWRFAALPPDAESYRGALRALDDESKRRHGHGHAFARLEEKRQDEILTQIAAGEFASDAERMRLWFEDVRADAVKLYIAHPDTLARMGYSGIANGGDGEPKSGFVRVGVGEREAWEPVASMDLTS